MFLRAQSTVQSLGRRLLSTIRWSGKLVNPYGGNLARKSQVEQAVADHAKAKGVNADEAVIKYEYVEIDHRTARLIITVHIQVNRARRRYRSVCTQSCHSGLQGSEWQPHYHAPC
jgi:hypothetical protein